MRWILAIVLVVVWGVLLLTSQALGGVIHLLLVAAGVVLLLQVFFGHRVPPGNLKTMTIAESHLDAGAKKAP